MSRLQVSLLTLSPGRVPAPCQSLHQPLLLGGGRGGVHMRAPTRPGTIFVHLWGEGQARRGCWDSL